MPSPPRLSFDRGTLLLTGMDRNLLTRLFPGGIWAADDRVGCWRRAALHFAAIREILRSCFCAGRQDEVPASKAPHWPKLDLPPLRPDQQTAVNAWRDIGCRGQIIMPTGTGKSEIGLAAMVDAAIEAKFAAKWGAKRDGWSLIREGVIRHDRQTTFVPDFVLRHDDGTEVLFEIVGFWTPGYLEKKRATL